MKVSPHFLIERNGIIHQLVDTDDRAWHAGESSFAGRPNCNEFSIGIELEGDERHPFTDPQYLAMAMVCRELICHHPGLSIDRIVGHCHVSLGRKTDPGPHFDWDRLRGTLDRLSVRYP